MRLLNVKVNKLTPVSGMLDIHSAFLNNLRNVLNETATTKRVMVTIQMDENVIHLESDPTTDAEEIIYTLAVYMETLKCGLWVSLLTPNGSTIIRLENENPNLKVYVDNLKEG